MDIGMLDLQNKKCTPISFSLICSIMENSSVEEIRFIGLTKWALKRFVIVQIWPPKHFILKMPSPNSMLAYMCALQLVAFVSLSFYGS